MKRTFLQEFRAFLTEYNVMSLLVAFVMGSASTNLMHSLVNDIFMPLVAPLLSDESWKEATLTIGVVHLAYGSFIAELLNFLLLALIIFFVTKKLLKIEAKSS